VNAPNRRVVVFLFKPGLVVNPAQWPCPKADTEAVDACKKRFWSNGAARLQNSANERRYNSKAVLAKQELNTFGCRFYERMCGKSPCERAEFERWARVEIKAPADGVVIERNLTVQEIVVDNTTNLFQVADLGKLFITANCPEDDLPLLEALQESSHGLIPWTVRTVGSPPMPGYIDDISYLIDPNQHTAVVKGYIENKQAKLRGGQFIKATVELPAPEDVVEIPIDAMIEDGLQTVVFVETDAAKQQYTMRRVALTHRFENRVFVRSKPFAKGEALTPEDAALGMLPKEPLRPGERILGTAVNELKAVVLDRESEARVKTAQAGKNR
jgi:cobalt-zinc-cadmium efflux system membrane fusion protein